MRIKSNETLFLLFCLYSFVSTSTNYLFSVLGENNDLYNPYFFDIEINKTGELSDIPYSFTNHSVIANVLEAYKTQRYELTFREGNFSDIPNYIKVEATANKGNFSPILYFSAEDSEALESRLQFAKGNSLNNEMWIKKEQFEKKNFFVCVQCQDEKECSYRLNFTGHDKVIFEEMKTYSYYISDNNKEMLFQFRNEFKSTIDSLTIYATGGKNITLSYLGCIGDSCEPFQFEEGAAITTKTNADNYYNISVTGEVGAYITVGIKVIFPNGIIAGNALSPDMGQISGFLRKEVLEKECYTLPKEDDVFYITGTLYNSIAEIRYLNEDQQQIDDDIEVTRKGFFSSVYNYKETERRYICIQFLNITIFPKESFSYSIQLQSKKKFMNDHYTPQFTGYFYPRITPSGTLVYFNNLPPKPGSDYMVYNMVTTKGYPKMYIFKCEDYPNCELDYDNPEKDPKVQRISEINRISSFNIPMPQVSKSPIDFEQYILVVKCEKPNIGDYDHCEFMTSIFGDQEEVLLIERQPFSQYMLNNTFDQFLIDFSRENQNPLKVEIDFLVISGDVSFELKFEDSPDKEVESHKYFLANKIFYSITIDDKINVGLKKIRVDIKARINSYYIVDYKIIRDLIEETNNQIYSGMDYLIPIFRNEDNRGSKYVNINRVAIINPESILTTFYSLNCKIQIEKYTENAEQESLPSFEKYSQDFYVYSENYTSFQPSYNISISDYDKFLISDRDICMVYVSSMEIYNNDTGIRKEILVNEGVPQRISFEENLKSVRYLYPHADPDKNLTVSIHLIYLGKFKVKFYFRDEAFNTENEYSQDTVIFIQKDWIQNKCKTDELCTMTVEIESTGIYEGKYPQIETTIKQVKNIPFYLPRGIIKNEFLSGDAYLYLYTDVGKNNQGYITVNYKRGSGFIYAKIVDINQKTIDKDPDWRNYRFPKTKNETGSLRYDFFNKKILFAREETSNCEHGCYILISIKTSVFKKTVQQTDFQFLTLLADFSPSTYKEANKEQNKIEIEPEEYVIGSIYELEDKNKTGLFEYYVLQIPYDASSIEIDWQSNTAELFIKLGDAIPEINDTDFHYSERKDTNIIITKQQINKQLGVDENTTLADLVLVFGVYANIFDSLNSAIYSFRVHLSRQELNIYKVSSDQKTICTPDHITDNEYRCLFMIIYQKHEYSNDLIAYAKSQSPSAILDIYANFIDNEIYNTYQIKELQEKIPTSANAKYNTRKEKTIFIYFDFVDIQSNAYVSVISDSPEPIEFFTSLKASEEQLSPNPRSDQIFSMDLTQKELKLDFITSRSISIKVESLYGTSTIYEEQDKDNAYYLRGSEDSFNLILAGKPSGHHLLNIGNNRYGKEGYKNPGFAFITQFKLRGALNLDEIQADDTSELIYNKMDFPIYYYSKIFDRTKDINAFFYLHNVIYADNQKDFNRQILSNELVIKGTILEENDIYEIKRDENKKPDLKNTKIIGIYDSVLQTGNIIIPSNYFNDIKYEKPTLYLAIEKGDNGKDIKYSTVRGEVGLNIINGDSPVIQKSYQFGKLKDYNTINVYKLKADYNNTELIRIQFSANSKYINFAINTEPNKRENSSFSNFTHIKENGVTFVTLKKPDNVYYLYLNVFLSQDIKDDKLKNFVFKYMNGFTMSYFYSYSIFNSPKIELQRDNKTNNLKVTFNPIDIDLDTNKSSIDISILYTVKLVLEDGLVNDEYNDTISITESKAIAKQYKHTKKEKMSVEFQNAPKYKYAQVIATITSGSVIEYLTYQASDNETIVSTPEVNPEEDNNGNKKNTTLYIIIGISSLLVIVVVVLVVVVVKYQKNNKDLLNQVNKISFAQSGSNSNEKNNDNLLLKEDN